MGINFNDMAQFLKKKRDGNGPDVVDTGTDLGLDVDTENVDDAMAETERLLGKEPGEGGESGLSGLRGLSGCGCGRSRFNNGW